MKGILCYHSNSGNTKLTAEYVVHQLRAIKMDCVDIALEPNIEFDAYDVVGFASWTFFLGLPPFFEQFIAQIPQQSAKPAFILNTFGMMPGQSLMLMEKAVSARGFVIIAGHSFHTPESYPPYIIKEWNSFDAPSSDEFEQFNQFIAELDTQLATIDKGTAPAPTKLKIGLFNRLIRPYSLKKIRKQLGNLQIDTNLCTDCGRCAEVCLYQAIAMNPSPVVNMDQCAGCWACFNHCPEKAIFTDRIKDAGHYAQPITQFASKMQQ